ncbi:MAG: VWA domain-containing protein [Acidobacteria bacterium]|nr:VWA domain-containing protein [Acidobacteriota bacterium]MCB9398463.1 VWA domain-containing protein [Acidobacteriota bacterium]
MPNKPTYPIFPKALFCKAFFFFCAFAQAFGQVHLASPGRFDALNPKQTVEVIVDGPVPQRVELLLNGQLVAARKEAPWTFVINWNLDRANTLTARALFPDQPTQTSSRTYPAIQVDVVEQVVATDWFPFALEQVPSDLVLTSQNRTLPFKLGAADGFPLDVILLLDISGSMNPSQSQAIAFIAPLTSLSQRTRCFAFDGIAYEISPLPQPNQWQQLYSSKPRSVIYDAIATTCNHFGDSPRRLLVLISDGYDDGSHHDPDLLRPLLQESGAILIWYNPTPLSNPALSRLAYQSGGLLLTGDADQAVAQVQALAAHQVHVQFGENQGDLKLKSAQNIYYPHWP